VDRIKTIDDVQLHKEWRRLERDVDTFRRRAATVAAALEVTGRSVMSDPLHQRFTSIHDFLRVRLSAVEEEVMRRAAAAAARPKWSFLSIGRSRPFASGA
jgi:hypothetical protein